MSKKRTLSDLLQPELFSLVPNQKALKGFKLTSFSFRVNSEKGELWISANDFPEFGDGPYYDIKDPVSLQSVEYCPAPSDNIETLRDALKAILNHYEDRYEVFVIYTKIIDVLKAYLKENPSE